MTSAKLKIGTLLTVHVAAGLALARMAHAQHFGLEPAVFTYLALVFADAGLLGIWSALGTTRPRWRFPAVLAATTCLGILTVVAEGAPEREAVIMFLVVALPAAVNLVVLTALKYGRRKLRLVRQGAATTMTEGFQFALRHLFLATTLVAVVFGVGRGAMSVATSVLGKEWEPFLILAVVSPFLVVVELATLWGALGIGRPAPRLALVLPTAFPLGLVPPVLLQELGVGGGGTDLNRLVGWFCLTGLQATLTAATLLVFRSCGWRLVRGTSA